MTTPDRLALWNRAGVITDAQRDVLGAIVRKDRFSVYLELHAMLYLGVLAIAAGVLWTVKTHFADLGDTAIVLALAAVVGLAFSYCVSRARPYSPGEIESPTLAFDYVLYLGCAVFAIELGFIEDRFALLRDSWDNYLLLSAAVFFAVAYRFDNRFVLSLALSTLAAWFGIKLTKLGFRSADSLRMSAIAYGALVAGMGATLQRLAVKKHFVETHLHVAATALFVALLSGVDAGDTGIPYLAALIALGIVSIAGGIRYRRFVFVGYGVVWPYLGISLKIADGLRPGMQALLAYGVVSASAVALMMVFVARRVGRDA